MNPTSDNSGFGKFVPGFEFLQNLIQPGSAQKGMGTGPMAGLGGWVAPTLNVEDLDKRIEELKAVHFWLDQNAKALGATVQALEVQRMTLATLRDMNVSMGDVAKASDWASKAATDAKAMSQMFASFTNPVATQPTASPAPPPFAPPAPAPSPAPAPQASAPAEPESPDADENGAAAKVEGKANEVDPMQWWGALQQQFQTIAVNTLNDLAKQSVPSAMGAKGGKPQAPAKPASKAKTAPKASVAAKKKASPVRKTAIKKTAASPAKSKRSPRA